MVQKSIISFLLVCLVSCSNSQLTKNLVKEGSSVVAGGNYSSDQWSEKLVFKRVSWYKDFALLFDSHIWKVKKDSNFLKWFSKKEKSYIDQCDNYYIIAYYALDSDLISGNDFLKQLDDQNTDFFEMPNFKSHLKLHPHFIENSFQLYKIGGICQESSKKLSILFPGYREISVN